MRHCAGTDPLDVVPRRVWCLLESSFVRAACVASWLKLWCGLKPITIVLVLGSLRWSSDTNHCKMLCVTSLGLPVCSYHTVYCLYLCLLGLCGRGQPKY